jgi:OmcA/MtrC family decaheme c-type cytochrome
VPEIVFSVTTDGAPLDILATPLTRLSLTVAGPTTDYAQYWSHTIQGSGATGTLTAEGGDYRYTFPAPMPATATGSYAIAMEAYSQPGGASGPRFAAMNPIAFVPVTDATAEPRREVVALDKCNSCHFELQAHGGNRKNPQYCIMCHNPNNVNDDRVSRFEGETVVAQSVDMKVFIHRIHMGEDLADKPYILYGFPAPSAATPGGTPIDFAEVRYPGDRKACWACHEGTSYALPLSGAGRLPSKIQTLACTEDPAADADSYCATRVVESETLIYPEAAACTGCHNAPSAIAHAQVMTAPGGAESCATCHGPGASYDVELVHAPTP